MEAVSTWEMILLGLIALLVILWFQPGIKVAFQHAAQVEQKDWKGFLLPIVLVALLVIFLIAIA
ncbi:MAG: hypothetical protein ACU4EQ_05770 [Candidatus Nitrosoglobus sp.]|jgi:hypothetical protein